MAVFLRVCFKFWNYIIFYLYPRYIQSPYNTWSSLAEKFPGHFKESTVGINWGFNIMIVASAQPLFTFIKEYTYMILFFIVIIVREIYILLFL